MIGQVSMCKMRLGSEVCIDAKCIDLEVWVPASKEGKTVVLSKAAVLIQEGCAGEGLLLAVCVKDDFGL